MKTFLPTQRNKVIVNKASEEEGKTNQNSVNEKYSQ